MTSKHEDFQRHTPSYHPHKFCLFSSLFSLLLHIPAFPLMHCKQSKHCVCVCVCVCERQPVCRLWLIAFLSGYIRDTDSCWQACHCVCGLSSGWNTHLHSRISPCDWTWSDVRLPLHMYSFLCPYNVFLCVCLFAVGLPSGTIDDLLPLNWTLRIYVDHEIVRIHEHLTFQKWELRHLL